MPTLADRKIAQMQQVTGETRSNLTDLEWDFYSANSGLSPANKYSISDHKLSYYKLQGAAGKSLPEVEKAFFSLMGAQGNNYDDLALDFYTNLGFGPGSISGLAAWYDASSISSTIIAKDTFDRSKNLVADLDPSSEVTLGWTNQTNATVTLSGTQKRSGTQSVSVAAIAGGNATAQFSANLTSRIGLAGTIYTNSVWVFNAAAVGRSIQTDLVTFYTTAGRQDRFNTITVPPGVWTRITNTWTNPAGDTLTNATMTATMQGATAGDIFYIDDFQIELGSQATPFVWGDITHLGVSDSGHVWTQWAGVIGVSGGKTLIAVPVTDDQKFVINAGTSDVNVSIDVDPTQVNGAGNYSYSCIITRGQDINNHYFAQVSLGGTTNTGIQIFKRVAGVNTSISSVNVSLINSKFTLRVTDISNVITVYINGVQVLQVTDSSITGGTYTGVRHGSSFSNAIQEFYTNFSVKTPIYSDGAALPIWPDISGNYRHATQTTTTKQPLVRSANKNLLPYRIATSEIDTTGWTSSNETLSVDVSQNVSGRQSLKAVSTGIIGGSFQANGSTPFMAPVVGNQFYSISIQALINAVSAPTGGITISLQWFDSGGSFISGGGTSAAMSTTGSWQPVILANRQAPANAAFATILISVNGTTVAATTTVNVDNLQIEPGSSVTSWLPPVTLPSTGKATVQFDGANGLLTVNNFPLLTSPYSAFVVAKRDGLAANVNDRDIIIDLSPLASHVTLEEDSGGFTAYGGAGAATGGAQDITNHHVVYGEYVAGAVVCRVDGIQVGSSATGVSNGDTTIDIGSSHLLPATRNWLGEIAAVLIFNRALSTNERQRVERYLKARYGTP